jgi:hypothetical protein
MTKRKLTEEEVARFTTDDDQGVTLFNCYNLLDEFENSECKPWIEMCAAVDKQDNFQPFLDLLQSRGAPPAKIMPFLNDLFARHKLLKAETQRRSSIPLYRLSGKEALLLRACEEVKDLVTGGRVDDDVEPPPYAVRVALYQDVGTPRMKVSDAIDLVAKQYASDGLDRETIDQAYYGRHGGQRRMKQRLKKRQTRAAGI